MATAYHRWQDVKRGRLPVVVIHQPVTCCLCGAKGREVFDLSRLLWMCPDCVSVIDAPMKPATPPKDE